MARSVETRVMRASLSFELSRALDANLMPPSRDAAARRVRQMFRAVVRVAPWTDSLHVMLRDYVMPGGR